MDDYEALELAPKAVEKVSHVATALGATKKRKVCGRLGGELLIAADHLKSAGPEQQDQLLRNVRKLLRDIEWICSWPADPKDDYPCLRGITQAIPGTHSYKLAEGKIRCGLLEITAGKGEAAENAILHIRRFTRRGGIKKPNIQELSTAPKSTPAEYPNEMKVLVYDILRKHMCCTCTFEAAEEPPEKRHLAKLLLQPVPPADREGNVQFDMLFSSAPLRNKSTFGCWQDVQLLVPRVQQPPKKPKKQARFDDDPADSQVQKSVKEINDGQFCGLIRLEANARLCLTIQGGKLQRFLDSEPLKQVVEHAPSISLATVLRDYHLTPKMKAALAYVLAQSVWQFYDSDWMKTRWTSETIQFVREYSPPFHEGEPNVFASKPYFSVRFGEDDPDACESSSTFGEIHRYPRVRALGIMLVEIGIGSLLPRSEKEYKDLSQTAKINRDWLLTKRYSDLEEPWPDFDYGTYRTAVKKCLDPGIFATTPFMQNVTCEELANGLKKRRKILYDCVVFPLEEFLRWTGWKDELHKIGPLKSYVRPAPAKLAPDAPRIQEIAKSAALRDQKDSKKWLNRIYSLNEELKSVSLQNVPQERIRIAILDTGYDADAEFFQPRARRNRLIEWKDWVEDAKKPQDCDGHGTHLVSLIMKMAPEADICVARVANDRRGLDNAGESVAEAIEWAQSKCEANIISMSFGYIDDQQSVSKAIRNAVNDRNESILFFAAAANCGSNEREMFPARHECVISIRGTNSYGKFLDFNPPQNSRESTVLGTLGLEVPSASLSHETGEVHRTGTSMATAVAAGMAGMLLGYINSKSTKNTYHTVRRKLRKREGMLAMFESITPDSLHKGCLYVAPWDLQGIPDETRWAMFEAAVSKMS